MKTHLRIATLMAFATLVAQGQVINTVVGGGFSGVGDGGPATSCELSNPHGIGFDAAGNMYVADGNNLRVRKINQSTGIITTIAGNGNTGYNGTNMPATSCELHSPWGLVLDASGNIYFSDVINNLVRKITVSTGIISTIAGKAPTMMNPSNGGYNGDGIAADSAMLYRPEGIAIDQAGNIYIADWANNRIRKITASTGIISTVAGNGSNSYNGDGIAATSAGVFGPTDVAIDAAGNIYIADNGSNRIRKVDVNTGLISTFAGNGGIGFSGDGGPSTSAQVSPYAITFDASGSLYITDSQNSRVRKINAANGFITTVTGTGSNGFSGDGGLATAAQITSPSGIAVDAAGNIYISDSGNNRIRKMGSSVITGLNSIDAANAGTNIFPNPFSSETKINFSTEQKDLTIRLFDISGREVRSESFSGNEFALQKEELTSGIYFIHCVSGKGLVLSQKIVIE